MSPKTCTPELKARKGSTDVNRKLTILESDRNSLLSWACTIVSRLSEKLSLDDQETGAYYAALNYLKTEFNRGHTETELLEIEITSKENLPKEPE